MASFRFIVAALCLGAISCKIHYEEKPVERPLRIGAFNVQKLGNTKLMNERVMKVVRQVLLRYDVVLVQEIVTTDGSLMEGLVADLNNMAPSGSKYLMTISERLGRDRAKEQYAFIYRSEKLRYLKSEVYPDPDDSFMRPPYIVHFGTPTLRDITSLLAIGIHTQPRNAANETSKLADVYDYAAKRYKQRNAIFLGDMNAGCQNVRISDWDNIHLWTREEFQWLIKHDTDTTVSANCCPYDRIVIAGEGMIQGVIWNSVHVFNFKEAYGLTTQQALNISDHWPVEVQLRGKVSNDVQKYLNARLCISVDDTRKASLPPEIQKQKTAIGFQIKRSETSATLIRKGKEEQEILSDFQKLAAKYPQLISKELVDTVSYKVSHGATEDRSSFTDPQVNLSIAVDFDISAQMTSVQFCSQTTAN